MQRNFVVRPIEPEDFSFLCQDAGIQMDDRKSKYAKHVIILNPGRYEDLRTLVEDMGDDKQKTKMVWAPELTSQGLARIRTSRDLPAYCQELVARESEYAFLYIELARFGKTRPGVLRTDKTYDKFFFRRIGNIWDLEKLFIKWRDFYTFRNEKDELFDFSEERFILGVSGSLVRI